MHSTPNALISMCCVYTHLFIFPQGTEKFCPTTVRREAGGCFRRGEKRVDLGRRVASACPPARESSTPPSGATSPLWFTWMTWVMLLAPFEAWKESPVSQVWLNGLLFIFRHIAARLSKKSKITDVQIIDSSLKHKTQRLLCLFLQ